MPCISRLGNCRYASVAELFFISLKEERVKRRIYVFWQAAKSDVFDYIEGVYKRVHTQSHLD